MRISDWSSDVCSSDLSRRHAGALRRGDHEFRKVVAIEHLHRDVDRDREVLSRAAPDAVLIQRLGDDDLGEVADEAVLFGDRDDRSEEHTSELQSLMRISYAVFCLKTKKDTKKKKHHQ